ncbi:hypothetical protein B0H67DRAFT_679620 [Lasiosphaeris hirsuta]|uniref:Uncharacterized protein n=1 Tax=Lasiosphaeris hirsuta TaxID=260670 RepID=A0AA40BDE3_9PEZI|nr:hypothetical protein B0H67DRAFT_679620 [Lasiosphaeris hirsuta]
MATTESHQEEPQHNEAAVAPLFTDLTRVWELDGFSPPLYRASIFYMKPSPQYDVEKPYFMNIPVDPAWLGMKQTNVSYTRKTVAVADIRGHQHLFSLDVSGFQLGYLQSEIPYEGFADSDMIVSRFYDEVKSFLMRETGAADVLPFDFQVRYCFPRPPSPAIEKWLCDYRTVSDQDRAPTDIIFPDYLGETYNFWPNSGHRFYYVDEQKADEAWLIKCYDSSTMHDPSIAQFAPHVSFPYVSMAGEPRAPRESIEVRTFVFYG